MRGREALLKIQEWSGGLGEVGSPTRRAGKGYKALLESQRGSGRQEQDGWPCWSFVRGSEAPRMTKGVGRPSQRDGRGLESLPEGCEGSEGPPVRVGRSWEALLEDRDGSEDLQRGLGGVGRPFRRAGRGREVSSRARRGWEGQKGLGGPPGGTGGVRRPSQRIGIGWESLEKGQEGLGWPEEVRRPTQRAGRSHEAVPEGWEWSGGPPERVGRSWEALLEERGRSEGLQRGLGGVERPFRRDGRGC